MTYWQVREVCEAGREGRIFKLLKDKPLTVGRSDDCSVQLNLKTVDNKHAVLEWSDRKLTYIVRDLGSTSGTFVNNAPLSRGIEELRHGNSLRFGPEKSHIFRIEECYGAAATPTKGTSNLMPTSTCTQTSPQDKTSVATQQPLKTLSQQHTVHVAMSASAPISPVTHFVPTGSTHPPSTIVTPGGQQGVVFTPGQQHGAFLTPGGQIGYFSPGGQQGTVMTPQSQQQGVHSFIMQQGGGYPYSYPSSPAISVSSHIQPAPLVHMPLHGQATQPPTVFYHSPTHTPAPLQQQLSTPTPASLTSALGTLSVEDIENEVIAGEAMSRSDGRRQLELDHSPNLASGSTLYGQPSWWGEEEEGSKSSFSKSEFRHVRPGSQILRDFEYDPKPSQPDREDASSGVSSTTASRLSSRLSVKDELRLKAICNSVSQEQNDPSSSWVVDFGSGPPSANTRRPQLSSKQRPRSADNSPVRVSHSKRDVSPSPSDKVRSASIRKGMSNDILSKRNIQGTTISKQRDMESPVVRHTPNRTTFRKSPSPSPSATPIARSSSMRRATPSSPRSPRVRRPSLDSKLPANSTTSKKLDKPTETRSKASVGKKTDSKKTDGKTKSTGTNKPEGKSKAAIRNNMETPLKATVSDKTYTKFDCVSNDELQSSLSDLSLTSATDPLAIKDKDGLKSTSDSCVISDNVQACLDEEGKLDPRKQWTNEKPLPPDNLMLASIEARMRRLSKIAQGSAVQLSSVKRCLQERGVVNTESHTHTIKPFSPITDQHLPEWKFFNKEVDSILRSIRSVEKWLGDIDSSVNSMQPLSRKDVVKGEDSIDHKTATMDSDGEFFQDSIEDNFSSCSNSD